MSTESFHDVPLGMPSPEALQMATDAIRHRYVLPETMQHSEVRSECLRLAYLIQSYGLMTARMGPRQDKVAKSLDVVSLRHGSPLLCRVVRNDETRELAEAC
jgi:hypothetical protein